MLRVGEGLPRRGSHGDLARRLPVTIAMLRIDVQPQQAGIVKLEGRIVGPWIEEVRTACRSAMAGGTSIVVDLAGVDFVDRDAAALLRDLSVRGARLVNASPFVAELLRDPS
jgi:anti-anti-sigma regulatory factor